MSETELNQMLLDAFPELAEAFDEYTSWQDGLETGCFLTHEDLLLPRVRDALDGCDASFLVRVGDYVERLMTSNDDYAVNVATVGLIEGFKAYGNPLIRRYLGKFSLEEHDALAF